MAHELILIVDDNEQNRKLARDVLQFAGFRTLEAAGGVEGLSLAVEHRPDLVLMDIRMPDLNGTEAVRKLREDERTAAIPVVELPRHGAEEAAAAGWLRAASPDGRDAAQTVDRLPARLPPQPEAIAIGGKGPPAL